jgi:nucleotide-binding universal stress UspA family protein
MFKHLLLPTDGSPLSETAVFRGIDLARETGARITGLHVSPQFHLLTYRIGALEDNRESFDRDAKAQAERYLEVITKAAREAHVTCEVIREVNDHPYQAICDVARQRGCDLIMMASHGRRGVAGLLMGSETQKVLAHTTVPVLVWR